MMEITREMAQYIAEDEVSDPQARRAARQVLERLDRQKNVAPEAQPTQMTRLPEDASETFRELQQIAQSSNSAEEWLDTLDANANANPMLERIGQLFAIDGKAAAVTVSTSLSGTISTHNGMMRERILSQLQLARSFAPQGAGQTLLVTHMLSVHDLIVRTMAKVADTTITSDQMEVLCNRATRLMRSFDSQLELLHRLQGKLSQQKIVVERVQVAAGGQAIVGTVEATGRGAHGGGASEF